jgi:hypothetical protein
MNQKLLQPEVHHVKKTISYSNYNRIAGSLFAAPISSHAEVQSTNTENGIQINPLSLDEGTWTQTVDGEVFQITKTKKALFTEVTVKNLSDITAPDVSAVQWAGSNSLDFSIDGGESFYVEGDQPVDSVSSAIVNPVPDPPESEIEVIVGEGGGGSTCTVLQDKEGFPYFSSWKKWSVNGKIRYDMTSLGLTKQRYSTSSNNSDISAFKSKVDEVVKDTMTSVLTPVNFIT